MLRVERNKVQVEARRTVALLILADDRQIGRVIVATQRNRVVLVDQLHNFGEVGDGKAERERAVSAVDGETIHAKLQVDESNVAAVHRLE